MHGGNSNVEEVERRMHSDFAWTREAIVVGKCGRAAIVQYGRHEVREVGAVRKLLNWQ
jgi:hypothetical protein